MNATDQQARPASPTRRHANAHGAIVAIALALLLQIGGCASDVLGRAREAQAAGQHDAALQGLEAALRRNPESAELRSELLRARASALDHALAQAQAARAERRWEAAFAALQRAQALQPDHARVRSLRDAVQADQKAEQRLAEAEALFQKGQREQAMRWVEDGLQRQPQHAGWLALKQRIEAESQRRPAGPQSRAALAETRPISLDFREAGLRQVLDLVTRHSGVDVVLDKDIRSDLRITVNLRNTAVEDVLELIAATHQLTLKVLNERSVLLYPSTPEKHREYQELVVRVFHLANADAKNAAAFLRSMARVREPFVDERSNMIALREPAETMEVAARLLALYDAQEPEVMLELEVLELRSSRLTDLGIRFPDSVSLTPLAAQGTSGLTVASLQGITTDRIGVSVGGVLLNLRREVGDFEILANPRVRARNREKARILIGDRLPIVTTTTSQSGFVGDSISYVDVGLKLEAEPTIYADDEVGIRLSLEVSSLSRQVRTASGSLAYEIGTRTAATALRLRDGETQILAGLVNREDRSSANRLPGLGDVPLVGRLFSSQLDNASRTELVLAVTPRILRNVRRLDAAEAQVWVGTEGQTRLRGLGGQMPARAPAQQAVGSAAVAPSAAGSAPAGIAQGPTGAASGSAAPMAGQEAPSSAPVPVGPLKLAWRAPARVAVSQEFEVVLSAQSASPLRGMVLRLAPWNSEVAQLADAAAGNYFKQGEAEVNVARNVDPGSRQTVLSVLRRSATGATGDGPALVLRLKALREGQLDLTLLNVEALRLGAQAPAIQMPEVLVIEVTR